jgi:hypothetical protein
MGRPRSSTGPADDLDHSDSQLGRNKVLSLGGSIGCDNSARQSCAQDLTSRVARYLRFRDARVINSSGSNGPGRLQSPASLTSRASPIVSFEILSGCRPDFAEGGLSIRLPCQR